MMGLPVGPPLTVIGEGKLDHKVRQTSRLVQMLEHAHIVEHFTIAGRKSLTVHAKWTGRRRRAADLRRQSPSDGGTHHRYLVVLLRDDVLNEAPKLKFNLMVKADCVLKFGSAH